jgi:GT2 family glycosyltransferase
MPNFSSQTAPPDLVVVVPATDAPPSLARCRAAIEAALGDRDRLVVVTKPAGVGPSAARNAGAREAREAVVVFVDSDVAVHPNALDRVRAAFASDPGLGAIFGRYDFEPEACGRVSRFRNLLHAHVHAGAAGPARTFWAGLGAIRADLFHTAGGFDERLFPSPSVEDVELGARLRRMGARIVCDPDIQGTHLKRWTLGSMTRTDALARARPWTRLALAGRAPGDALNLAPRRRIGAVLALAATGLLMLRRPRLALVAAGAMAAAESSFFVLLHERGGVVLAIAGAPLLGLHYLSAAMGAALGVAEHRRAPLEGLGS